MKSSPCLCRAKLRSDTTMRKSTPAETEPMIRARSALPLFALYTNIYEQTLSVNMLFYIIIAYLTYKMYKVHKTKTTTLPAGGDVQCSEK